MGKIQKVKITLFKMLTKLLLFYLTGVAHIEHLREKLFTNYSSVDLDNNKIDLGLNLAIRSLNKVDHVEGTVDSNIWLRYYWKDERLSWNMDEYNYSNIVINTDPNIGNNIWTPDIYLYNTAEKPLERLSYTSAVLYSNGDIIWSRPGMIKATCLFNLEKFPYDTQSCYFKFGSWSYDGNMIELYTKNNIDLTNFKQGEEWKIISTNEKVEIKIYECCPEPYHAIYFEFEIERMPHYYVRNIIVPIFATSSLLVMSMMIPWESGERISFTTTIMLSIIVFLLILSDNLPKTNDIPIMSTLVVGLMFFSLAVVFTTVLLSSMRNMHSKNSFIGKHIYKLILKFRLKCQTVEGDAIRKRSISYNEALDEIVTNKFDDTCVRYSEYIENITTLIFTFVFVIYCLVAIFII